MFAKMLDAVKKEAVDSVSPKLEATEAKGRLRIAAPPTPFAKHGFRAFVTGFYGLVPCDFVGQVQVTDFASRSCLSTNVDAGVLCGGITA